MLHISLTSGVLLGVALLASVLSADESDSVEDLLDAAAGAAGQGEYEKADELATKAIAKDKKLAAAWYVRGRARFCDGKVKESVADFDEYVKLLPSVESRQWERGIACYYAGEYEKGAKQFELYQTYHDNDVENSVWRYLCMAKTVGVEKAESVILPIKNDRRVPMMQVFDLYRGKLTPNEVLVAARAGDPDEDALYARLFYAHLYLGLWHEVQGNEKKAREHILLSAAQDKPNRAINRYMWEVARIHAEMLKQKPESR